MPGRVRFAFQPSEEDSDEEGLSGGMRMVDEGVMDGADASLALHVKSELPVGQIKVRTGPTSAYTDKFELEIKGREAHGAYPHDGFDAISLSAQVINALQTVISRRLDPTRGKVLTVETVLTDVEFQYRQLGNDNTVLIYTASCGFEEVLDVRVTSEQLRGEVP